MTDTSKVAEIFSVAGEAFTKLSKLAMILQSDAYQESGKWEDDEIEKLKKAISQFGYDLEKISEKIKTKSTTQIKNALKTKVAQSTSDYPKNTTMADVPIRRPRKLNGLPEQRRMKSLKKHGTERATKNPVKSRDQRVTDALEEYVLTLPEDYAAKLLEQYIMNTPGQDVTTALESQHPPEQCVATRPDHNATTLSEQKAMTLQERRMTSLAEQRVSTPPKSYATVPFEQKVATSLPEQEAPTFPEQIVTSLSKQQSLALLKQHDEMAPAEQQEWADAVKLLEQTVAEALEQQTRKEHAQSTTNPLEFYDSKPQEQHTAGTPEQRSKTSLEEEVIKTPMPDGMEELDQRQYITVPTEQLDTNTLEQYVMTLLSGLPEQYFMSPTEENVITESPDQHVMAVSEEDIHVSPMQNYENLKVESVTNIPEEYAAKLLERYVTPPPEQVTKAPVQHAMKTPMQHFTKPLVRSATEPPLSKPAEEHVMKVSDTKRSEHSILKILEQNEMKARGLVDRVDMRTSAGTSGQRSTTFMKSRLNTIQGRDIPVAKCVDIESPVMPVREGNLVLRPTAGATSVSTALSPLMQSPHVKQSVERSLNQKTKIGILSDTGSMSVGNCHTPAKKVRTDSPKIGTLVSALATHAPGDVAINSRHHLQACEIPEIVSNQGFRLVTSPSTKLSVPTTKLSVPTTKLSVPKPVCQTHVVQRVSDANSTDEIDIENM